MTKPSAAKQAIFREPHPLALELLQRIDRRSKVLEIGPGSGRNFAALISKADVTAIESEKSRAGALQTDFPDHSECILSGSYAGLPFEDRSFDTVLSTHALLHGTPDDITLLLKEIARVSGQNALLFITFGSIADARFGKGTQLGPQCFAPGDGDEAGVAHSYFTQSQVRSLLRDFTIERLNECTVDAIAGTWAHPGQPLHDAVHWFVVARKAR